MAGGHHPAGRDPVTPSGSTAATRERLQKVLAAAGLGSRRACQRLITDRRVSVNGQVVDRLGTVVDPQRDRIRVDGRTVKAQPRVYYLLNKPRGVVCTNYDPAGRRRAIDLLAEVPQRLFCVGRLDADSQGLLLLTNDGELAACLTHPRFGVPKTYRVVVDGRIDEGDLQRLRNGLWLSEGRTQPATVKLLSGGTKRSVLQVRLREGRNRQVRRMLARLAHPVRRLRRVAIGRLNLRGVAPGAYRRLSPAEVRYLRRLAGRRRRDSGL